MALALASDKIHRAMAYYRLSKDDGKQQESDSISNQRKLVHEYLQKHDHVRLVGEAQDDGFTGTNFDRPGFCAVMKAIESGEVDCVIVKDLSRLGREYIETGKYLEMIFPALGVRFIAINDDLDSEHHNQSDDIIIPVKNLMNESYCRELSKKLRAQFQMQRRNGEFIGAFTSYGYCKSPEDKHKLVIDDYAAGVVKGIFALKMQGHSQQSIADTLNRMGELPPAAYKKQQGLAYQSGFSTAAEAKWGAGTIKNILTNRVYLGELIQGKRGTPNYKIRKMKTRKAEDWVVVERNHAPIVDALIFGAVQQMLGRDTRTAPSSETVQPLAGVLFCPDCQRAMCRRSVTRGQRKFYYYVCSTHKSGKGCSSHSLAQGKLECALLHAIQQQVQLVVELEALMREVRQSDLLALRLKRYDLMLEKKHREIDSHQDFRMKLFEAMDGGLIDRDEYQRMRDRYAQRIEAAQAAADVLLNQRASLAQDTAGGRTWVEQFLNHQTITCLSREVVVALIDKVYIHEDKRLQITFNFRDEMEDALQLMQMAGREAV